MKAFRKSLVGRVQFLTPTSQCLHSQKSHRQPYDCVELPTGQTPLLGLIPLEDLGLDPDLQNQKLRHLPMRGKETYVTVL